MADSRRCYGQGLAALKNGNHEGGMQRLEWAIRLEPLLALDLMHRARRMPNASRQSCEAVLRRVYERTRTHLAAYS